MPTITFKVSVEEARKIRARAQAAKAPSVSDFLRKVALSDKPTVRQRRVLKKDPLTGIMVDATPGPIVTDDIVKALLADFP
jgi:hypothetical protein